MRTIHWNIYKIMTWVMLLWFITLGSFVYANEDQQSFDEAKTRINNIQNPVSVWSPSAPWDSDQKWSIANILSRIFNGTWKMRSIFIAAFENLSVWYVPSWTGTWFANTIIGQSWDTVNIEWNINIEWIITVNEDTFNWWIWVEWEDEIYYNSWSVGVWVASPDSILHVWGDIKIWDSGDGCDSTKAGALRFNGGYIQLCANN